MSIINFDIRYAMEYVTLVALEGNELNILIGVKCKNNDVKKLSMSAHCVYGI